MQERVVRLQGVSNFRDYGGYATRGGGRLKTGVLYRSANHAKASDADLDAIHALGIGAVVVLLAAAVLAADAAGATPLIDDGWAELAFAWTVGGSVAATPRGDEPWKIIPDD